ncbi:unnamed protein product [Prorocentrum cordatum]|nr:unnamed protein product [Polarella glacialis]CAK0809285.1 unnamed protein product [Polarella glacialis]
MSRAQLGGVTTLDFTRMPPPTPEQAAGLAGCLRLCARLQKLDLQGCQIGAEGARALAGALPSLPGLQELRLGGNRGPARDSIRVGLIRRIASPRMPIRCWRPPATIRFAIRFGCRAIRLRSGAKRATIRFAIRFGSG